jgi:hypothetical protein
MSGIKQMSTALWPEGIGLSSPERQQLALQLVVTRKHQ